MNHTPYLGLRLPEQTDPATEADINYNSQLIDANIGVLFQRFGGLWLRHISQAAYDELAVKDSATLYVAVDAQSGTVTLYLGEVKIGSGSGAPSVTAFGAMQSVSGTAVHATVEEV
ncbi:MAG: hypothetical protein J6M17_10400 [Ruminococcus sp.]|nr:hypothetical protein [Ruminococcus sp.]